MGSRIIEIPIYLLRTTARCATACLASKNSPNRKRNGNQAAEVNNFDNAFYKFSKHELNHYHL